MKFYEFKSLDMPVLTSEGARQILKAREDGVKSLPLTFNLGLSRSMVELFSDGVAIEWHVVSYEDLQLALRDEEALFIVEPPGRLRKAVLYSEGNLYKLKKVREDGAPTLEVNGVALHRVEEAEPWEEASLKVEAANVRQGIKVLDICTGLGYTTILSVMKGAAEVWTIEKDVNVLRMAEANPWSKGLESPKVKKVLGNAAETLAEFSDEEFEAVIHDPPSIAQASELYTVEFYRELHRVLKRGGTLSHFTGPTTSRARGMDVVQGVSRRLKLAGFAVRLVKDPMGVVAVKE